MDSTLEITRSTQPGCTRITACPALTVPCPVCVCVCVCVYACVYTLFATVPTYVCACIHVFWKLKPTLRCILKITICAAMVFVCLCVRACELPCHAGPKFTSEFQGWAFPHQLLDRNVLYYNQTKCIACHLTHLHLKRLTHAQQKGCCAAA